jgi:hypothetical protein
MAASTNIPTKLKLSQVVNAGPQLKFDTDTLVCLLVVAGSGIPSTSKTGVQYISDVTGTNAEVTGTGYARQTLTSVTVAYDSTGTTLVDFSFANITFSQNAAGFTNARYIIIADTTSGAGDSTHPVIAVCDPNTTLSAVTGDVVLSSPTGGLIQWQ